MFLHRAGRYEVICVDKNNLQTVMTNNVGLGLPLDWKNGLISWARGKSSIRELWLFGSRAKGTARVNSVVDIVSEGVRPNILITDHLMPGMSGVELARTLRSIVPELPVLIVSGYAETDGLRRTCHVLPSRSEAPTWRRVLRGWSPETSPATNKPALCGSKNREDIYDKANRNMPKGFDATTRFQSKAIESHLSSDDPENP